jgi:hypothetical protein
VLAWVLVELVVASAVDAASATQGRNNAAHAARTRR